MLAIRLTRIGSKKRPTFRVVVTEARTSRDSRVIETLGYYNPKTKPAKVMLDRDRVAHWVKAGARPSNTVRNLVAQYKEPVVEAAAPAAVPAAQ
jgi:small subunit ribosomal protein S16